MATLESPRLLELSHFHRAAGEKSLLRFTTAGSVDDGKSTLIGRLLHDTNGAFDDQIEAVKKSGKIDFSLLTDGLRSEREQGITIDVAYRYFETARRKFIIADTPGHEQYTRNMATGASTADVAVILVDARKGVLEQSRRHAYISALLGIRHLLIAVNKMDLVDFDRGVFDAIRQSFLDLRPRLRDVEMTFVPVSALEGDNVVENSPRTPWYAGPSLLEFLEIIEPKDSRRRETFRFPVQLVIRPNLDFRGFAGQVTSGSVRVGDEVAVLPSARRSRVARIVTFDGDLEEAHAPMSVVLTLEDEIELSRGGLITEAGRPPRVSRRVEATLVWMSQAALKPGRGYLLRHGPHEVQARVTQVLNRVDVSSLEASDGETLALNEIGLVRIETAQPLAFDAYAVNRASGGFVLLDPLSNLTVAAGMLERAAAAAESHEGPVTAAERRRRTGHGGCLLTADPESSLAPELERWLFRHGAEVLRVSTEIQPLGTLLDNGFLVIAPQGLPAGSRHKSLDLREFDGGVAPVVARLIALGVWDDRDSFTAGEGI